MRIIALVLVPSTPLLAILIRSFIALLLLLLFPRRRLRRTLRDAVLHFPVDSARMRRCFLATPIRALLLTSCWLVFLPVAVVAGLRGGEAIQTQKRSLRLLLVAAAAFFFFRFFGRLQASRHVWREQRRQAVGITVFSVFWMRHDAVRRSLTASAMMAVIMTAIADHRQSQDACFFSSNHGGGMVECGERHDCWRPCTTTVREPLQRSNFRTLRKMRKK